jgi:hypothetical protein
LNILLHCFVFPLPLCLCSTVVTNGTESQPPPFKKKRLSTTTAHRAYFDKRAGTVLYEAKRLSANRFVVLSPAAALHCFRSLMCRIIKQSTVAFECLRAAARNLVSAVCCSVDPDTARMQMTALLLSLTTDAVRSLSLHDVDNLSLTPLLCALSGQIGDVARVRATPLAQTAVANAKSDLSITALSKYTNDAHLRRYGEPITLAFAGAALGLRTIDFTASGAASSTPPPAPPPIFADVARDSYAQASRLSALVTILDCALKSTNGQLITERGFMLAQDIRAVTGTAFVMCHIRVSPCISVHLSH